MRIHAIHEPLGERFWSKVDKTGPVPDAHPDLGPCWLWTAAIVGGYGSYWYGSLMRRAHRLAFMSVVGPIPPHLMLDHLCRVRNCVKPDHLEIVTPRQNTLRGDCFVAANAIKTHCPRGHEYAGSNLHVRADGSRECRTCRHIWKRTYRQAKRERSKFTNPTATGTAIPAAGIPEKIDAYDVRTSPRNAGPESIGRDVVRDCAHDLKNRHEDGSNAGPVVTKTRRRNDS